MSGYQYYEFAAVDGPISDEGLKYAQGCSSRAKVSRLHWQNTYTFGDFHGSVDTLLKYYDAHFYIANWGTVRFCLAFSKGAITSESIQPYLCGGERYEQTLTVKEDNDRLVICWERNEEGGWGWTEGWAGIEPLMAQKNSSAYEQVATQLMDLRDAYAQAGDSRTFDKKLKEFRAQYSGRSGMLRRIKKL